MTKEYLPFDDFVPYAPDSHGKVRINHSSSHCSGGRDSMIVERKSDDSISAYCFRCGLTGWKASDTIDPYKFRPPEKEEPISMQLPDDLVSIGVEPYDVPIEVYDYVRRTHPYSRRAPYYETYGYDETLCHIKWSNSAQRIYYYFNADNWMARSINPKASKKWIENMPDKDKKFRVFGLDHTGRLASTDHDGCTRLPHLPKFPVFIVEDILSALCLQALGYVSYCLYGSNFNAVDVLRIVKTLASSEDREDYVLVVWMDDDNPQIKMKQAEALQLIRSMRFKATCIKSNHDPKTIVSDPIIPIAGNHDALSDKDKEFLESGFDGMLTHGGKMAKKERQIGPLDIKDIDNDSFIETLIYHYNAHRRIWHALNGDADTLRVDCDWDIGANETKVGYYCEDVRLPRFGGSKQDVVTKSS